VPATKSASWTECACFFDDTITAVINNQDCSGNESILPSPLEIDDLCNQVFACNSHFSIPWLSTFCFRHHLLLSCRCMLAFYMYLVFVMLVFIVYWFISLLGY